jgi:hypothetical protein
MQDSSKKRTGRARFLHNPRVQIPKTGRQVQHSKILLGCIQNLEGNYIQNYPTDEAGPSDLLQNPADMHKHSICAAPSQLVILED